jgi:MFS family permease
VLADAEPGASTSESLWRNRDFLLLWGGQAISGLGDIIFATTLALWIAGGLARGQSWAPQAVAGVLVVSALPDLLIGPLAGVFVDRWDRRRTMLRMDGLRALLIAVLTVPTGLVPLLPPGLATRSVALASIYLIGFLAAVCGRFFSPARMAALGEVVPKHQRPRASSFGQMTTSIAVILGPPAAAALYFGAGPGPALALNALSFLVSYLAIRTVRVPPLARPRTVGGESTFRGELVAGLRYFRRSRVLSTVLITAALIMLAVGALNALDLFFLRWNLHAPLRLYGVLSAAYGGGVLLGAALAGRMAERLGLARGFWLSTIAFGALTLAYARLGSFALAVPVFVGVGVLNAAINVTMAPLLLNATPRELVGRVFAVFGPVTNLMSLLSMAVAGYLAGTQFQHFHGAWLGVSWGPIDTIFTIGGIAALGGGLHAWLRLRRDHPSL